MGCNLWGRSNCGCRRKIRHLRQCSFFIQYPGQQGIMKGYNITFTQQNSSGTSEEITQLDGEITLTFQLTPQELEGIDPSTLVVYKRAADGSISQFSAEFDWATNSLSITTSHLCEFFIMGKQGIPTQRLAGSSRYATAAAISGEGFSTSDYVVLASGENYPDALAGTVLAAVKSAPVLLAAQEALSSETLPEIKRLQAKHIYLLGGTGVIGQGLEDLLAKDYTVTRISGSNRYETAVRIGELVINTGSDTAIIATGSDYPDALSVASFAGQKGLPILFTEKDGLNAQTKQALSKWGIKEVILIGGTGVISAQTEAILRDEMKLTVNRLSGTDRYQTGLEIAKYFVGSQPEAFQYAALSTGNNFPDALAGASLAAKLKMPIFLTGKEKVGTELKAYLKGLNLKKIYVFGGQGAVPDSVKEELSSKK